MISLILASVLWAAGPKPEVYAFTATWCGPCKRMKVEWKEVERKGYKVRYIDVDRQPDVAKKFKIHSLPSSVILKSDKEVDRVKGFCEASVLLRKLKASTRKGSLGGRVAPQGATRFREAQAAKDWKWELLKFLLRRRFSNTLAAPLAIGNVH